MALETYDLRQTGAEVQRILDSVETIDNVPQPNSQNAVKSGGVYGMIQQSKTEYDEVPVEGSSKAVRSGGLFNTFAAKADAVPVVNHGTSDTTFALTAGVYHVWGDVSELNLTLAEDTSSYLYTYMFQFSSGAVPTSLTLPSTILGMDEIEIVSGMVYQIAITNNIARVVSAHLPTEVVSTPFLSRITANGLTLANDRALIRSLHGNTLVWNQMIDDSAVTYNSTYVTKNADSSYTINLDGVPTNNTCVSVPFTLVSGHKYLCCPYRKGSPADNTKVFFYFVNDQGPGTLHYNTQYIHTASVSVSTTFAFRVWQSTTGTITFFFKIIDLTAMFGEGNEPTLAEFEALYPLGNYATDAGRLLDFKGETLVSKDTEENVLSTITINPTAMYGYLNGEGEAVQIFPSGMRSAGSVFDTVEKVDGKWYAKTNVGSVNLGALSWSLKTYNENTCFQATMAGRKTLAYGICTKYSVIGHLTNVNPVTMQDKSIVMNTYFANNAIYVKDTSFNDDAATFKSAMDGVMLNYELATPRTYLLTDEWQQILNTAYQVETGGMEIILPDNGSEPYTSPACLGIEYTKNI